MSIIRRIIKSPGVLAFGSVSFLTVAATFGAPLFTGHGPVVVPAPVAPPITFTPAPVPVPGIPGEVNVRARISQTKIARNGDGRVYVELGIEAPKMATASVANERPTDMIIVLDRSGSMSDMRKMDYAKSSIHELANRMSERDRFALISFDDYARLDIPLTNVTASARENIHNVVNGIYPGSSTNISSGFDLAANMLGESRDRSVRVLLISDGVANSGVSSTEGLSGLAASLARRGAVVSTIGLGADYNQVLLSAISDHGMGNYNYLESLEALGKILESDLRQSRALYASASEMTLQLSDQVSLESTGDYPFTMTAPGVYRVSTGQLLGGGTKTVTLTLRVPASQLREVELGRVSLAYTHDGASRVANIIGDALRVSVVDRYEDAVASIRKDVYYKSWVGSNVGKAKEEFAAALASGNEGQAKKAMLDLRAAAAAPAAAMAGSGGASAAQSAADEMAADYAQSFSGDAAKDSQNQNMLAKKQHAGARALQRGE